MNRVSLSSRHRELDSPSYLDYPELPVWASFRCQGGRTQHAMVVKDEKGRATPGLKTNEPGDEHKDYNKMSQIIVPRVSSVAVCGVSERGGANEPK